MTEKVPKKKNMTKKNINMENPTQLKMIDLCAGTGAFSLAFENTGLIKVVYANDFEESSKKIYDANFDHELTLGDLCTIDVKTIPKHDVLTSGFPCQPFSIAGKQLGFDDPRTNIFWKVIEIIKLHKPKCVVLENVKNLVSHDNGDTFKTIITSLEKEGYHIKHKILNTEKITDIPQHRERIYIVCFRDKKHYDKFNFNFPEIKNKTISELLEDNVTDKYYYNDENNKIHKMVIDSVINEDTVYQFRRVYVRENKSGVCPTLTANMGAGGHNVPLILGENGARKLTPKECFNFQGFPENYVFPKLSDTKLYKLAGNAVSVPVVKLIANKIMEIMK